MALWKESHTGREQLRLEPEAEILVGFGNLNSNFRCQKHWNEKIYECEKSTI